VSLVKKTTSRLPIFILRVTLMHVLLSLTDLENESKLRRSGRATAGFSSKYGAYIQLSPRKCKSARSAQAGDYEHLELYVLWAWIELLNLHKFL